MTKKNTLMAFVGTSLCTLLLLASCESAPNVSDLSALSVAVPSAPLTIQSDKDLIIAHMTYLADDALEGRDTGTVGYDKAADYVANEFKKLGLLPAGDKNTFFQAVRLQNSTRDADAGVASLRDERGVSIPFVKNEDFAVGVNLAHTSSTVTAPVVFVGYGVVAPELGRDDYAGLDVEGKIVALLPGTPSGLGSEERAYYGGQKAVEASKRGAVGIVNLRTPAQEERFAFPRLIERGFLDRARMGWILSLIHI